MGHCAGVPHTTALVPVDGKVSLLGLGGVFVGLTVGIASMLAEKLQHIAQATRGRAPVDESPGWTEPFGPDHCATFGRPTASAVTTASSNPASLLALGSNCLRISMRTCGLTAPIASTASVAD